MIDETAKKFFSDIRSAVDGAKDSIMGERDTEEKSDHQQRSDPASQLKAFVESGLKRMNLVTREEFDTQQAVLQRTREKLEALEILAKELEDKINAK